MYRAVLLCVLLLLIAAPSITSVQGAKYKSHGAGYAAGAGAADSIGARLLQKAGRALLAEPSDAVAAKPAENVIFDVNSPVAGSAAGDASANQAAASPAAAAAPKDAAAAQQPTSSLNTDSSNQQPAQQQQQSLATPTVTQPAAPQPFGGAAAQQPAAVVPTTPEAQQPAEPQPHQQQQQPQQLQQPQQQQQQQQEVQPAADSAVITASSPKPTAEAAQAAEVMLTEPGLNKLGYHSGVQQAYAPYYNGNYHQNSPQPYPSPDKPSSWGNNPSHPAPGQYPSDKTTSPPGKYVHHYGEEEEEDHKVKNKHDKHNKNKHDNKHDKDEEYDGDNEKDKKHKKDRSDDEDYDKPGNKMHHTGKAAKKMHKAKNGDKYLSDDDDGDKHSSSSANYQQAATEPVPAQPQVSAQTDPEQASSQSLVETEQQASTQGTPYSKAYTDAPGVYQHAHSPPYQKPYVDAPYLHEPPENSYGNSYSTYEAESPGYDPKDKHDKEAKAMHHTGKAAKKLYKAQGASAYLADGDKAGAASVATAGSLSEKERDKVQKLQKYYEAEAELLAAELEEGDDVVSTFAKPSRYSNKAAKYAAMALKAQGAKKIPVLQPQLQVQTQMQMQMPAPVAAQTQQAQGQDAQAVEVKPTLANFASNLLKKKPTAADKAGALSAPKPSLKLQKKADAQLQAAQDALYSDEEVSWEDYMANPQLYAGMPSAQGKPGVVVLTHEQYQKAMGKKPHGKKGAAQQQNARAMATRPVYASVQGESPYYDPYSAYEPYGFGAGDGYEKDAPFDMDHNYHPPLRRKEMKNTYNFRAMPHTERTSLGYTSPFASGGDTDDLPVVIAYTAKMTCGPEPGPAGGIGTCSGTGIGESRSPRQVMMSFTCTIDADASNVCGLKYVQGMTITAQGMVNIGFTEPKTNVAPEVNSLQADVLPITGVYVPGRRTTLLADVVTLLSGVKGGSLMLRSDGNRNGHFSFYFWR